MTPEALQLRGLGVPWPPQGPSICTMDMQNEHVQDARDFCLVPTPELCRAQEPVDRSDRLVLPTRLFADHCLASPQPSQDASHISDSVRGGQAMSCVLSSDDTESRTYIADQSSGEEELAVPMSPISVVMDEDVASSPSPPRALRPGLMSGLVRGPTLPHTRLLARESAFIASPTPAVARPAPYARPPQCHVRQHISGPPSEHRKTALARLASEASAFSYEAVDGSPVRHRVSEVLASGLFGGGGRSIEGGAQFPRVVRGGARTVGKENLSSLNAAPASAGVWSCSGP